MLESERPLFDEALAQSLLSRHRPTIIEAPFRHALIDDLFPREIYDRLVQGFQFKLSKGLSAEYSPDRFYHQGSFDAYAWILDPTFSKDWNFFYTQAWRDFAANLFHRRLNENTRAALHHHPSFGNSGLVHNDFNLTNFVSSPLANQINPWLHQCIYMRKRVVHPLVTHHIRSVAVLFYFGNTAANGGETALYNDERSDLASPNIKIAPTNNRALLFEVSPKSFHAYLANGSAPRNALAQWFHAAEAEVLARYGLQMATS